MIFFRNLPIALVLFPSIIFGNTLEKQRIDFLQAENFLQQGNIPAFLAYSATLTDYPLYPYLQYQWLKNRLQDSNQIKAFIKSNPDNYHSGLLRNKWLDFLAQQERWDEFRQFYRADNNIAKECQLYWAQYKTGTTPLALNEAERLWTTVAADVKECAPLFLGLTLSPMFTSDLAWQRFELTLTNGDTGQAARLLRLLPISEQKIAELWLQVHKKPVSILNDNFLPFKHQQAGRIFAYGIGKLAQTNLEQAIAAWDKRNQTLAINLENIQQTERQLALALAYQHDNRAFQRLAKLPANDGKTTEWKIRAALWEQDWQHVSQALAGLTAEQRQQPVWQYWQARCNDMLGDKVSALTLYEKLAADRSFYGFLAADLIGKPYNLADNPVLFTEPQLTALATTSDFRAIQELKFFNRELEARRLWFFATDRLDKGQLKLAAKLAQQWQWDQLAIMTLAKADYWDDMALRFPVRHTEQIKQNTDRLAIDPSIIFGLIRQESMLHKDAVSPAGARGLMQLMPATAKLMANKLHEPWLSDDKLFDPDTNIRYGSTYFKQLLEHFKNHLALAISAYNAGPNRISKWLPQAKPVPADIWIESIPYEETRKYVTAVLFYTMIYQLRTDRDALKLKNLLYAIDLH